MDKIEVTAEMIQEQLEEGRTKTEIAEEYGITAQKVGMILSKDAKSKEEPKSKAVVTGEVMDEVPASVFAKEYNASDLTQHSKITILTAGEYAEYSEANGRYYGRKKDQKTLCSIEELRALINSGWKPSSIMKKHGMTADEFKQLVWSLSQRELRDRALKYSIEQDFIERG